MHQKKELSLRGRTLLMLTAVLAGFHLVYNFIVSFRLQRLQIPGYVYVAASGGMTAVFVFFCLTSNFTPSRTFDISGIVTDPVAAKKNIAIHQIDSRDISYTIPAELYPELEYIVREPLIVASSKLPAEKWGKIEQTKIYNAVQQKTNSPKIAAVPKVAPKVIPKVGLEHTIKPGENLWELANAYGISFSKMMYYNQDVNPRRIHVGQKIFIPGAKDPLPPKSKSMVIPVATVKYITSGYGYRTHPLGGGGRFHKGVDIAARSGTSVRAVLDGKVSFSGWKPQMGYVVEIEHENDVKTVYGHNRRLIVKAGQKVRQGQSIAEVGSTGRSTAPHLHFEVWKNGKHRDPLKGYLPKTMKHK